MTSCHCEMLSAPQQFPCVCNVCNGYRLRICWVCFDDGELSLNAGILAPHTVIPCDPCTVFLFDGFFPGLEAVEFQDPNDFIIKIWPNVFYSSLQLGGRCMLHSACACPGGATCFCPCLGAA